MRFGKIPSKILFVRGIPTTFQCNWDDVDTSIAEGRQVVANFPADAESADNVAQALRWGHDQFRVHHLPDAEPKTEERKNEPFAITVIGLEKRMEGGRAFKVIDCVNRMFDLREDILLEALQSVGVSAGGRIAGEFVFAKLGSQMRLVRVGSSLHDELVKSQSRRQSKNVKESDLVVGGVYANRRGLVIYLGRVDTVEDILVGPLSRERGGATTAGDSQCKKLAAAADGTINRVLVVGEHLSISVPKYYQNDIARHFDDTSRNASRDYYFQFGKTFTAVELVSRLEVSADFIDRLRERALVLAPEHPLSKRDVTHRSPMLNIRRHGEGARATSEYEALLANCKE
jgi:hypothetical protein